MKILKVRNLYGYPSYTDAIVEYSKSIGASLILDRTSLLKAPKEWRMSNKPKILVDSFTAFLQSEVPIIGYKNDRGVYLKDSRLPHREHLVDNVCQVKIPSNLKRVPSKVLASALKAKVKKDFLDSIDPEDPNYKVVKGMITIHLPASLKDPFTKVNKKTKENT